MKKRIDLVMFDLDGTLADTGHDLASSVNFTRARFDLEPLPERRSMLRSVGAWNTCSGTPCRKKSRRFSTGPACFSRTLRTASARSHGALSGRPRCARLLLRQAKGRGEQQNVSTDARRGARTRRGRLLRCDLRRRQRGGKKTASGAFARRLRRFHLSAASAVIVGDGDTDIEAGKRAGVMTCGVTYGLGDKSDLIAAAPDLLIDDLTELYDHFC
jgi:Predicted phosphatases